MQLRAHAPAAIAFAAAGALSRFSVRHHQTRWQIVIFWGAAAAYQALVLPARGKQGSPVGFLLDASAATIAILCMKLQIEGTLS